MRIVALLAVRNEELYMERCLEHLFQQGVETCVIDNASTDRTRQIAERFIGRGVFQIEYFPYSGFYDWVGLLQLKESLATRIEADWFIHNDADEILEAPLPKQTLAEAICAVDRAGYNAINFDEFVFVPTSEQDTFEGTDYVREMHYYYFFEPFPQRLIRSWKKTRAVISLAHSGGHRVAFDGLRLWPTHFVLRHYIILSAAYAQRKYGAERVYSQAEVDMRGWHGWRAKFNENTLCLPDRSKLKCIDDLRRWDKSEPQSHHIFIAPRQPDVAQSNAL